MYINFIVTVERSRAEEIGDDLLLRGALSVSQESGANGIKITALFDDTLSDEVSEEYAALDPIVENVEDRDWQNEWIAHYEPVIIDDVCAIIPYGTHYDTNLTRIVIDPRDAFGSGTHPTTIMCLRNLNEVIIEKDLNPEEISLLDIGTGSGILAIFSVLKGIGFADGCDIDEKAVIRAAENAERNGVSSKVRFQTSSIEELADSDPYDIVCANLQSVLIENNIDKIINLVRPGGVIIASGIGSQWRDGMKRLFIGRGLTIRTETESSGWMGYVLGT